ncbi:MAG: protein kinase [Kofleriaceae bacterium]
MTGSTPPRRSLWQRLLGRRAALPTPTAPAAAEPNLLVPAEEAYLTQLAAAVAEGERAADVGGREFERAIDALWASGRERRAIEWLRKFLDARELPAAQRPPLRRRAVELLERRGELDEAVPLLEEIVDDTTPGVADITRALMLLAEHHQRQGDLAAAERRYQAVLARDVDYPNARTRLARLRAEAGRDALAAGETIASSDLTGVSAGTRYRLRRELGRGATGVVYVARDVELERDVAVKLLHPHLASAQTADALHQFFREARVMASLRHPNVVAVLDLDERARRIVMELAAGGTLRDVLAQGGPRPLRRALEHLVQILAALVAAHDRGFTHRDLKPANLMFRRSADVPGVEVMLGDFGIAHLPDARTAEASGDLPVATTAPRAAAVGTLAYMAPEQRRGEPATPAVDLFALAVVTFEMLTGRLPWSRDVLLAGARARGDFALPAEVDAPTELRAGLQAFLDDLGDPDPTRRPTAKAAHAEAMRLRELAIATGVGG